MEVSNIDELLTAQQGPKAPEMPTEILEAPEIESVEHTEPSDNSPTYEYQEKEEPQESHHEEKESEGDEKNVDDYGNPKAAPRTYTEDEVNEKINKAIRELKKVASNMTRILKKIGNNN